MGSRENEAIVATAANEIGSRGRYTRPHAVARHGFAAGRRPVPMINEDRATVEAFGDEWSRFDNTTLSEGERRAVFAQYFARFPWDALPAGSEGFDAGCGSGRWAALVADRVGRLHCVDASAEALAVARRQLAGKTNCTFHLASVSALPFASGSMDFGYSLGVLHHTPDPEDGLRHCVGVLKPGAPFLLYLYYRFDNRPAWFRTLWAASDLLRRGVSRLPSRLRFLTTDLVAAGVYWPLARTARVLERIGARVDAFPLSYYRSRSFYVMRNDALDRLGTRLERRFTRPEMAAMMERSGLERIEFNDHAPFWCAVGYRAAAGAAPAAR
jgi:ubiquinone/menaquinone biosynthesis C-methylase UbiE